MAERVGFEHPTFAWCLWHFMPSYPRSYPRLLLVGCSATLFSIGVIGLLLQEVADIAVGALLRGITVVDHFAQFVIAPSMVYAALLAMFVAMPWVVGRRRDTTSR